uniref:Uncharacterized protein n=1 Tax=Pseudo-nitzschia australis TaxID=44445 RepID=A0A7S4ARK8_9STRA
MELPPRMPLIDKNDGTLHFLGIILHACLRVRNIREGLVYSDTADATNRQITPTNIKPAAKTGSMARRKRRALHFFGIILHAGRHERQKTRDDSACGLFTADATKDAACLRVRNIREGLVYSNTADATRRFYPCDY